MNLDDQIAYVGLGSNLGDRSGNLLMAVRCMLEASFVVCQLSSIYETEPVDVDGSDFLNMVAKVQLSNISPTQMMARLLRIEYLLGRKDKSLKRARIIDLDILTIGDLEIHSEFLTVPHPRLHLRKFVLCPFAEISPDVIHRTLRRSISELLAESEDESHVRRWEANKPFLERESAVC